MQSSFYLCQILKKLEFSRYVRKIFKYQISRKSLQWQSSCSIRTDMTKLIVAFCNFTKMAKNTRIIRGKGELTTLLRVSVRVPARACVCMSASVCLYVCVRVRACMRVCIITNTLNCMNCVKYTKSTHSFTLERRPSI